jgi:hypothetical protein
MHFLPCFLCGAKLDKRIDKNSKPYFVCNPCGIQLFIRRAYGIDLLDKLLRNTAKNEIPFRQQAEEIYRVQALLTAINGIKAQIERLESQSGIFFRDKDKVLACDLLRVKLANLFKELEKIAKGEVQTKSG